MGRRHRDGSNSSNLQPCHCQDCLKQNPDGVVISHSALTEHRHRERLRTTFLERFNRTPSSASSGNVQDPSLGIESHAAQSVPQEKISHQNSPPSVQGNSSADDTHNDWLKCVVSKISLRLGNLYGCETHLIFAKNPSPDLSFVYPDPETNPQVNTGEFALQTNKIANHRLLDTEARFSYLLETIQALPPGQRLLGELDVKEELLEALNKIHRMKERHWTSQAFPDGHGESTVDTSMCAISIIVEMSELL
ncbi:hypothetical protein EV360DRAFT_71940 [Lentinula raphanica]|nr:hypothetical protein EV360DRAFT_71940 [Lentinula raphanica]